MTYRNPILVCDDDGDLAAMLQAFLTEEGYQTVIAPGGADALLAVRSSPIDIVILDIGLPDIDGLDVLVMLKHQERTLGRRLRVIMLTARNDPETAERAMEKGAFYYFTKPAEMAKIAEQVDLAVEQIKLERGYIDDADHMACTPEELFDQLMQASIEEAPKLDAKRFAFEQRTIVAKAPELAGVFTLRDGSGTPIYVEWAKNVRQRLVYFVALDPARSPLTKAGATFEYALGNDENQAGVIFDKLYNELGGFPRFVEAAPAGSKYHQTPQASISAEQEAVMTNITAGTDEDLTKVEALVAASPDDVDLKDWLAFRYFSQGHLEKAIKVYRELIASGSEKPEHHFYLGNALYKLDEVKEALAHWELVIRQDKNPKLAQKAALRLRGARKKHGM